MDIRVVQRPEQSVAMVRHNGPYEGIQGAFEELCRWGEDHALPTTPTIGLYWDNPEFTPPNKLRSAACLPLPDGFAVQGSGKVIEGLVPGGTYATYRHVGSYDDLPGVWSKMTEHIEQRMQRTVADGAAVEIYVNDPEDNRPEDLITELYMPLA